ncbi:glycosyltransferase [Sphingomonas sp. BIUV-7]|uniref:Glycosyltransferase n=1 Tax=Sphingomonas natans TaxID=3063330 RepID=A0ABT8Y7J4_9SPHN|nr:glycosyltransferase [Sphingomonas sp. BIUV-7]MDO6413670.1 glycosyltransferase [Sphingomonas sp. BIUV-7]
MMAISDHEGVGSSKAAIFTISSNNYMPYTRTLIESSVAHHPDADHFLCLADEEVTLTGFYPDACTIVPVAKVGITELQGFAFRYDIMEFNTAVKPYMFLHLFAAGYDSVIYFDPDIKIYSPLTSVFDLLNRGDNAVFTPHVTRPAENLLPPDDISFMKAGVYNLGFAAFRKSDAVEDVLRWWARRLRYQCLNAQDEGVFVDQKFMDLVPGFLDRTIVLRQTALNVAYWNLSQRELAMDDGAWLVDGEPLVFFHFSGFDPRASEQLSKHTLMFASNNGGSLLGLLDNYKSDLVKNGLGRVPRGNYAFGKFESGASIPLVARKLFREEFPVWDGDPFATFAGYLSAPAAGVANAPQGIVCTNLMKRLWLESPYLRESFNLHDVSGVQGLLHWFLGHAHDAGIDPRLVQPSVDRIASARRRPRRALPSRDSKAIDVSVIGYLRADTGVGEVGRLTLQSFAEGPYNSEGLDVSLNVASTRNNNSCEHLLSESASGRVQIFNINADQLPYVQEGMRDRLRQDAYRICVPFWELSSFPEAWLSAFDRVDEIWAPTRFIQSALISRVNKPVQYMPIALRFDRAKTFERAHFGLPSGRFVFMFSFDFLSFSGRKNPLAVIDAFKLAFGGTSRARDVSLVIKCVNSSLVPGALARLRIAVPTDMDIRFIDGELGRAEMLGLIGCADCVVSLHRSEGLGLLIAEAMALGVPVISTDYSASTELVSDATGFPVDYRLVPLQAGEYPHGEGRVWADPDLCHAAWQMQTVFEGAGTHGPLVGRAKKRLEAEFGLASVQQRQAARLAELGA